MTDKILVILFFFGSHITFNIVGSLSLSELLSLFYLLFLNSKGLLRHREVLSFTHLFLLLETTKVISEFFVSNGISSTLKGLAIPLFSVLNTLFLTRLLLRDKDNMGACLLTYVVSALFLGNQLAEGVTITDIITGNGYSTEIFLCENHLNGDFITFFAEIQGSYCGIWYNWFHICRFGSTQCWSNCGTFRICSIHCDKKQFIHSTKSIVISALVLMSAMHAVYVVYVNSVLNVEITAGDRGYIQQAYCRQAWHDHRRQ